MATSAPPAVYDVLRDYQRTEVEFLTGYREGRGINGSEPGTGKTPTTLACAQRLVPGGRGAPDSDVLILCPKIAIGTWDQHIREFVGEEPTIYVGSPSKRRDLYVGRGVRWLIAPYSMMAEIQERRNHFPLIVQDEAHWLRNHSKTRKKVVTDEITGKEKQVRVPTTLYGTARQFRSDYLLPLTGSPIINHGGDLWALLNMLEPREFPSYWQFVQEWFVTWKGVFGGMDIKGPRNKQEWLQFLRRYMVRHEKQEVLVDLPDNIRSQVPVEMTPEQRDIYNQIAKEMLVEWGEGDVLLVPNKVSQIMRLRQILVTPALIGGPHTSGAFLALEDALANEFEAGRSCLVFTPFNEAFPHLEALAKKLKAWCGTIHGGMSASRIARTVADFQANNSHKKIIVSQVLMGASWTATEAATSFFLGYDWRPAINRQAEDRAWRYGQREVVHSNYFVHKGTVDQHVMKVLNGKMSWQDIISKVGARELLLPGSV